eukprot:CAMPEP_0197308722 /NCGR_PEP_ID=MMETSP0891-20130614/7187_1 /TAXON_ID=44058 ORGANISM="Aureoumbra lagunensis, Strain CCMP1510" /NCGR_SAMPLE_ID=MMETSP0891 /ASSEMBLY_ACC=CAM_ASM_000534 /LENGTH=314 /DNA_ID=CAMNT_0042793337 /DNA_START=452 /DNA_END=1396 /DNA_ORIENTATION=-
MGLPRPRAAKALAQCISSYDGLGEVIVFATCARLAILCESETSKHAYDAVAKTIAAQLVRWEKSPASWSYSFDLAADQILKANNRRHELSISEDDDETDLPLFVESGVWASVLYMARMAASLDDFDPQCSRRAHVIKQIKASSRSSKSSTLRIVIESALRCGKQSRQPGTNKTRAEHIAIKAADSALVTILSASLGPSIASFRDHLFNITLAACNHDQALFSSLIQTSEFRQLLHDTTTDFRSILLRDSSTFYQEGTLDLPFLSSRFKTLLHSRCRLLSSTATTTHSQTIGDYDSTASACTCDRFSQQSVKFMN